VLYLASLAVPGVVPPLRETPGRVDRLGAVLGETDVDTIIARWTASA
jgi:hypothetical protein